MSAEVSANPLEALKGSVEHLQESLGPLSIFGEATGKGGRIVPTDIAFSTYTFWFFIGVIIVLAVVLLFKKKQTQSGLVPKGRFVNAGEALVEFVRKNVVSVISHDGMRHFPFLASIFFFILISNFIGLVPGAKTGTGIIAGTLAISFVVFIYFNVVGLKKKGFIGYFKGLVPDGVPGWIAWLVWLIEFISMLLRPITQALRLFANMFAGHLVLGIFSLLTTLFVQAAIAQGNFLTALPSIAWLLLLVAMYVLEVVVAAVQAYVFTLLTAVYIDTAEASH